MNVLVCGCKGVRILATFYFFRSPLIALLILHSERFLALFLQWLPCFPSTYFLFLPPFPCALFLVQCSYQYVRQ